ncbi:unnamed protein product [Rotaria sp. Silwood1]|nr:unnamed protein product [Rotaria sp. Silwood1]CAF3508788.1 unnamed protein product [Rotaria sp. Silwood1]
MNNNNNILQLSLHGNPLICDCWFGSIVDSSLINITDLSLLQCNSHSIMNISQNNFLCSYSQYCSLDCSCCDFEACDCHSICPSECLCLHNSLWSNHIVQCQQKKLSNIHIHLPETITELNYEENNIEQLQSFIFIGKNLLTKLNLAKNNIKNLTNDIFCGASNLYEINLSYNKNLIIKLSNINILFSCLKYLQYIILSKEQINKDEEIINIGWIIESNNDIIRLIRINEKLSLSTYNIYTIPISTNIYPLIQSEIQSTTSFSIYHQQSLISSNFIQHNQTFIIIIFFLLLFLLLFLLFLILLAICRRKFRHHLKTELQRQRSHHYYYHTNLHQSSIQIPNSNGTNGVNDSVYEQLPSLSSDSEQPFLYNEKKLTNINAPALPPYPPAFRRYHCCHSMNSHDYQYGRNTSTTTSAAAACYSSLNLQQHPCSTVLVLRNPSLYRNHHEYSCELQQCLVSNQQEKNSMICCNNQTSFIPTILCQCNDHIQNIDTCIYPNVHK